MNELEIEGRTVTLGIGVDRKIGGAIAMAAIMGMAHGSPMMAKRGKPAKRKAPEAHEILCHYCKERPAFKTDGEGLDVCRRCLRTDPVVNMGPRTGRNDPCPCGAGKKFKRCHGAATARQTALPPLTQGPRPLHHPYDEPRKVESR